MTCPLMYGDTICLEQTVLEMKRAKKPERSVIVFKREIKNQRGEVVH